MSRSKQEKVETEPVLCARHFIRCKCTYVGEGTPDGKCPNCGGVEFEVIDENLMLKERLSLIEKQYTDLIKKPLVEMILQYQPTIDAPPLSKQQMWAIATANDGITVESWKDQWMSQAQQNVTSEPAKSSEGKLVDCFTEYGKAALQPVIIAGSGPSLKKNAHLLKQRGNIKLVSCLHNFAFFEDNGIQADYYVNLDAGEITVSEVYEGGKHPPEHYWELSKDRTLVTVILAYPELLKKWQGKKLFYTTPTPDTATTEFVDGKLHGELTHFNMGGNALGACLYFARAVLGGCPICFVGADFCFDYTHKFHPFDSKYDGMFSGVMPATDIFGNRVYTWRSYWGFAHWFAYQALGGHAGRPGMFINCTEGGILGAFQQGNMKQIIQMRLDEFLSAYKLHEGLPSVRDNARKGSREVLLF